MTEKEVQKLKRAELLEILIEQSEEIEQLKEELSDAKGKLENRKICVEEAGSIAEAAMQLNGVFEAAQAAAQQYLENIQYRNENQERICEEMERKTREKCEAMERETAQTCKKMLEDAKAGADKQWKEVSERLENFYESHKGLRELLSMIGGSENNSL